MMEALRSRAPLWRAAIERLRTLPPAGDVATATQLLADYCLIARDLAAVRRLAPNTRMRAALESAYREMHAELHGDAPPSWRALQEIGRERLPAAVRALEPHLIWISLLFALAMLAGNILVRRQPELITLFASPNLIAAVQRGELWTQGLLNIVPSSILSVQILTNNIVVSVFAFCAGLLFGLGTFYIVALNGLMLGAIFAFTGQHGLDGELLRFIVAHGCVELPCMVLSGAAGAGLGEALARPAAGSRGAALRDAARSGGLVLAACVLLLVGAGFIEGYVSPRDDISFWARLAIGLLYGLFMVALLRGWLFRGSQACLRAPKSARSRRPLSDTPCAPQPLIRLEHGVRDGLLRRGDHGHAEVP